MRIFYIKKRERVLIKIERSHFLFLLWRDEPDAQPSTGRRLEWAGQLSFETETLDASPSTCESLRKVAKKRGTGVTAAITNLRLEILYNQ